MDRNEFMAQLERLLKDIPENDRKDALEWYQDYFDEAGPENEANVIQELGSPGKVASSIMAGMGNRGDQGEFTETGYQDQRFKERLQTPMKQRAERKGKRSGSWALIIILIVFASPMLLGIGGGVLGVIVGVIGALIGAVASVLAAIVAFVVGGVGGVTAGIAQCFVHPGNGLVWIGSGMVSLAVGMLLIILFLWLVCCILPKGFRAVVNFVSRVLHRGKAGDTHEKAV